MGELARRVMNNAALALRTGVAKASCWLCKSEQMQEGDYRSTWHYQESRVNRLCQKCQDELI